MKEPFCLVAARAYLALILRRREKKTPTISNYINTPNELSSQFPFGFSFIFLASPPLPSSLAAVAITITIRKLSVNCG
jgi:hypothetical protein